MAETTLTVVIVTAIWAFVGVVLPLLIQFLMWKSPDKGVIQLCLILTAVCCYVFWLVVFVAQLNPLFGPELKSGLIKMIQLEWNSN